MTISKTIGKSPRLVLMLTAGALLLGTMDIAIARNGGNSDNGNKMSNSSFKKSDHDHRDKDKGKHKDKTTNHPLTHPKPDKPKDETTNHPLTHPKPGPGPVATPEKPTPIKPIPVVRDHRPGGKAAGLAPGTIIRDGRPGASEEYMVVVSSGTRGTVTRHATDAELKKFGLVRGLPGRRPLSDPQ